MRWTSFILSDLVRLLSSSRSEWPAVGSWADELRSLLVATELVYTPADINDRPSLLSWIAEEIKENGGFEAIRACPLALLPFFLSPWPETDTRAVDLFP